MSDVKIIRDGAGRLLVQRFSPLRRVEHLLVILVMVLLIVTGFPQKFYDSAWAGLLLDLLGGLDRARLIHRVTGVIFAVHAGLHFLVIAVGFISRRMELTLLPSIQDLRDARDNVLFYLDRREAPPELPKFDYRQKFEYFGIVLGGMVMIATGLILMYPMLAAFIVPGQAIAAARVAHSNEALLALLVLLVWHLYGSHLSPEVFPLERTIFTGYISLEELKERHAREYRRLFPEGDPSEQEDDERARAE